MGHIELATQSQNFGILQFVGGDFNNIGGHSCRGLSLVHSSFVNIPVGGSTPHAMLLGVTVEALDTMMPSFAIFCLFFIGGMSHGGGRKIGVVVVLLLELVREK